MADLKNSLVLPGSQASYSNSSRESFHSAGADAPPSSHPSPELPTSKPHNEPSAATNLADASAYNGVQVYDVDAYLADPANAALLSNENAPLQPVQLGTQTSHNVSALYTACQAKGLTPVFDIEGQANKAIFRGVLRVGDATVALDEQWRSKKEARERLAAVGVEIVKGMGARKRVGSAGGVEQGDRVKEPNWVGMLQGSSSYSFPSALAEAANNLYCSKEE